MSEKPNMYVREIMIFQCPEMRFRFTKIKENFAPKKKKSDARKYNFEKNGFMRFIFCLVFFE